MNWLALRMLTGDRSKYLSLIFSVSFATVLMTQQISIFMGIITRAASQIIDVRDATIWVMDNKVRFIDEAPTLPVSALSRVRGVDAVEWAVRFHESQSYARLEDGNFRALILVGIDDATLVGSPRRMVMGNADDLRRPDAVIVDKAGYEYMWPGEPMRIGREFMIADKRVVLVGICYASAPFTTMPVLYTRMSQVERFLPQQRSVMNYVLAKPKPGVSEEEACRQIERATGLMALTRDGFFWKTIDYFLSSTGIPINFGITIALGFIVGVTVSGQTFYLFTLENLRQFGSLKAMGVTNMRLIMMVLLQASTVGCTGYALGLGLTAMFFTYTNRITHLAGIHMTLVAAVGVGISVLTIILLTSVISLRKVLRLEPAIVFRG